jgi:hypothetical protein
MAGVSMPELATNKLKVEWALPISGTDYGINFAGLKQVTFPPQVVVCLQSRAHHLFPKCFSRITTYPATEE